jgi:hypothetical protein
MGSAMTQSIFYSVLAMFFSASPVAAVPGDILVSEKTEYRMRWHPKVCSYAQEAATERAQDIGIGEGFEIAVLVHVVEKTCQMPGGANRSANVIETFTGFYDCL